MPRKFVYNPNSPLTLYEQIKKVYPRIGGLPRIPNNATPHQLEGYLRMYRSASYGRKGGCKSCG